MCIRLLLVLSMSVLLSLGTFVFMLLVSGFCILIFSFFTSIVGLRLLLRDVICSWFCVTSSGCALLMLLVMLLCMFMFVRARLVFGCCLVCGACEFCCSSSSVFIIILMIFL